MDYDLELRFRGLKAKLEAQFDGDLDVQSILFLIGVDLLGKGHQKFSKNEKLDLMHIAVCTVLTPYGYYSFNGKDKDGWPHFKLEKELPKLDHNEQQHLMKEAILEYFIADGYYTEPTPEILNN
jgi:sensor domain CHASE-containing protein